MSVDQAKDAIVRNLGANLVEEKTYLVERFQTIKVLLFEKYFMRNNSTAALLVIIDDVDGKTTVYTRSTGSKTGLFGFDLGVRKKFEKKIKNIFL